MLSQGSLPPAWYHDIKDMLMANITRADALETEVKRVALEVMPRRVIRNAASGA